MRVGDGKLIIISISVSGINDRKMSLTYQQNVFK